MMGKSIAMKFLKSIVLLVFLLSTNLLAQTQLSLPDDCQQLVTVQNAHWDATVAQMSRFERCCPDSPWTQVGSEVTVNLGRTGLAWGRSELMPKASYPAGVLTKREGDGRSPAGLFPLVRAFGHPRAPQGYQDTNLPFLSVTDEHCVDDKNSRYYNKVVDPDDVGGVSWDSAEIMKIDLYELGLEVGHNCPQAKSGFGSCIFFHLQRGAGKATAGCTSMTRQNLQDLVLWLKRDKMPLVVQLPRGEYRKLGSEFPR